MVEPDGPVTIYIRYSRSPSPWDDEEWKLMGPNSLILRHRHWVQWQKHQQQLEQRQPSDQPPAAPAQDTRGISVHPAWNRDKDLPPLPPEAYDSNPGSASHVDGLPEASTLEPVDPPIHEVESSRITSASTPPTRASIVVPPTLATSSDAPTPGPSHPAPQAQNGKAYLSSVVPSSRQERSIRSRGEKTSWYASSGSDRLQAPPPLPQACVCDLYVHTWPGGRQAWIFDPTPQWSPVELGARHPYLKSYILSFYANGDPSWVTRDTMTTYRGRMKKRERNKGKEVSSATLPAAP